MIGRQNQIFRTETLFTANHDDGSHDLFESKRIDSQEQARRLIRSGKNPESENEIKSQTYYSNQF